MNREGVKQAIFKATQFIEAANDLLQDSKCSPHLNIGKLSGKCRRTSMDLTRSLSEMRRPS